MSRRTTFVALCGLLLALWVGWRTFARAPRGAGLAGDRVSPAADEEPPAALAAPAGAPGDGAPREALGPAGGGAPTADVARPVPVSGRVRDTHGAPCAQHIVGFYPAGGPPPGGPVEWLAAPHARTDTSGTFHATLPAAGDWRLFVGYDGKVQLEDTAARRISAGEPGFAEVVLPAPTRLEVTVDDAGPPTGITLRTASVYRSRRAFEVERRAPAVAPPPSGEPGPHLDDQGFDESAPDPDAPARPAASPLVQRLRELRARAAPDDAVVARSALTDRAGRAVFAGLPPHEELRFAVSRGEEAFRVEGALHLEEGARVALRVALPPPLAEGGPLPDAPRAVAFELDARAGRATGPSLTVGVTWRRE